MSDDELAEAIKAHTQAMAELKAATDEQNEMARQMREIRSEAVWSALSDVMGGQIAQRREQSWHVRKDDAPTPTPPDQVKPMRGNAKATVTPRRIGYTVHRTGLMIPERDTSWHLTRKGADRAARRWVDG
jgi:hypothetical protein